jgi:hypothetical protein
MTPISPTLSLEELVWLIVVLPGLVFKTANLMDALDDRVYAALAAELRSVKQLVANQHTRTHAVLCAFSLLSLLLGLSGSWTPSSPLPFEVTPPLSWVLSILGPFYLLTEVASTVHSIFLRRERKRLITLKIYDPSKAPRLPAALPIVLPVVDQEEPRGRRGGPEPDLSPTDIDRDHNL